MSTSPQRCLVLAHDVGTSSLKSALYDPQGRSLARARTAYGSRSPHPGWFEQDPEDYWRATVANTREVLRDAAADPAAVGAMVFSTQAMGIIPVDAAGTVLHPNIAWIDGRAEEQADLVMRRFGGRTLFRAIVGTDITGKDVVPKLRWLRDEASDIYQATTHFLDVNGFLKFRATGRRVAEWSGACSYGFNLRRKDWERALFRVAGVCLDKLPPLVRSTDDLGPLLPGASEELGLPETVHVFGGCDDTQSAALGSGAWGDGAAHVYLGSSAWAAITTRRALRHRRGAVCLQSGDPDMNLLVGITESAGSHLAWFLDQFYADALARATTTGDPAAIQNLIDQEVARVPPGSDHLVFTPWLLGERCPVSTTTERGTIFNLGFEHTRAHFLRALLEGIAYNLRWILDQFRTDFDLAPNGLRIVGGGACNDAWLQAIADITGRTVATVEDPSHAGTRGAAACARVGIGQRPDFASALSDAVRVRRTFQPDPTLQAMYAEGFAAYRDVFRGLREAYRRANRQRFGTRP